MGVGKYFKAAFLNRWNLLAFLSGTAFAMISGRPDILLPVFMAGEVAYLGLLGTHPRFQRYVDASAAQSARASDSEQSQKALARITKALPKPLLEQFEALRAQCLELRQIALALKHPGTTDADVPLDDFQLAGLDRLLWIHLRLLYTQFAMGRFLQKTSEQEIAADIERLEQLVAERTPDANSEQGRRVQKTLEDNLETSRARLVNWRKARDNYELVKLEIDRLENKIRSLSEMAVNRQEPEFISGQVDQVASSMLDTEKTINELTFATGLESIDEEVPELMRGKVEVH